VDLRGIKQQENGGSCIIRSFIIYPNPQILLGRINSMRMARMGEKRIVHKGFVGKPGGKRPLGRPSRKWEDGIRIDVNEIGWIGAGGGLL
jgi:hypothetical protein